MIIAPRFTVSHIGRTGGDACKQIVGALCLPGVMVSSIHDPAKHEPAWRPGRDLILTIRRLPARELSDFMARRMVFGLPEYPAAEYILRHLNGERSIRVHTGNDTWPVAHYVRSETLRDDVARVLGLYYPLTAEQLRIIRSARTKPPLTYTRDLGRIFSPGQVTELYRGSPVWKKHEDAAYLVVPSGREASACGFARVKSKR